MPFRIAVLATLLTLQPVMQAASSLPSGGSFTAGSGAIVAAGNTLTINQSTFRGVINWNNFSIGQGGLVTFHNGGGLTLNRVTGNTPSTILGQLLASGSVYLLNPEGILIGRGANVHTGGDFLASTLNLSGTTLLSGPSLASVVNLGNVSSSGGSIYLIGHSVENAGSLTAPNGTAGLAAGSQVLLGDSSTNGKVLVEAPGGDLVDSGFIAAAQAELKSNGGNIYALAGNNGGQIQATGTATQNGHIWLIAEHGTAHVSDHLYAVNANGTGGAIETSGEQVVTKGAQIRTGKGGSWLLDPADLTIDSTLAGTIENTLNNDTNVTEQTTSSGTGGSGDIIVAAPISWSGNSTLILDAYHGVTVNAPITASNWYGSVTITTNDGGSGGYFAANSPITISSVHGVLTINSASYNLITNTSGLTSLPSNGNYALDADLSLSGSFTPLSFNGNFQGLGHTISGLTVSGSGNSGIGLFSALGANASVSNLNISGASATLSSGNNVGILAGQNGGAVYNTHVGGTVTASSFNSTYIGGLIGSNSTTGSIIASGSSATVGGGGQTGGLAGVNNGAITASYATGAVSIPNDSGQVGGLVGLNSSTGTIASSYATGAVGGGSSVGFDSKLGGLVGRNNNTITSSYASGTVSPGPDATFVGGLVGWNSAGSSITTSYATGAVSAGANSGQLGGLVGYNVGTISSSYATGAITGTNASDVGGLVGSNSSSGTIASSYATGAVSVGSGSSDIGGLAGLDTGTQTSNFWDKTTSGRTTDGGTATGLTTAQWLTEGPSATNTYGWDFTNTWFSGSPYPVLRAQPYILTTFTATRTYGGSNPTPTISSSVTQTGADATSLLIGTLATVDGTTATSNVGTYNIGATGQAAAGYQVTYAGTLNITDAPLTITANAVSRAYGANNPTFTGSVSGFVNGDTLSTVTTGTLGFYSLAGSSANVGSYAIHGNGLTQTNLNYIFEDATGNATALTVTPAVLTYNATAVSRTYGSSNPTFAGTVTGFVNSDTLGSATTGTAAFTSSATAASNTGSYAINGAGLTANNGNYTFAQAAGNSTALTINPAVLTYNATPVSRTYGASNPTFSGTVSGFVNSDTLSSATSGTLSFFSEYGSFANVGSYLIAGGGLTANNGNYTFTQGSGNATALTVNPAVLTYNANPVSRTYGASNPTFAGTVTGFVNSDTLSSATTGTAAFTSAATSSSNTGSYAINGSGLTATNYTFAQADGNSTALTINPAVLSYNANPVSRTYGASNPTFAGTVTGFVNSDTLSSATTGTAAFTSAATSSSNTGSYAINGSGLTATNYTFAQADGNSTALTINPAVLSYNANPVSRTYGASNPTLTGTVSGFVNNDTLSSATSGTLSFFSEYGSFANVGSYLIAGGGLTANNGNYTFTQASGNATALTVNPAVLTYNAASASRSYGASNPNFTGTVTGFVNNDTLSSATSGTAAFTSSASAASNTGSYGINGAGLTATNYTFTQADGNASALTINPALLTYTAASAARTYGASDPTFTGTVSGFVNGDTLSSATTGSAAFTSSASAASNVGYYAINGSGLSANFGNYTFTQASSNASALAIHPATLTYSATPVARTYGAANPTLSGTVTGFVNGQTLASATTGTASFTSGASAANNAGSYAINGFGLTANHGNYFFTQAAANATALTINPAVLTYTANPVSRAYGAANPIFQGTVGGFVNGQTLASATTGTASFTSPATTASAPGAYAIDGGGLTANHGNYVFTQAPTNATALTVIASQTTPTPTPTPSPTGAASVLTFAIGDIAAVQNSEPAFSAAYTGPAITSVNIPSILSSLSFTVTPAPISGPGTYTINATGTAPQGYTLKIAPATLTVVAGTPQSLPSQLPVIAPVLPPLLPAASAALFQMDGSGGGNGLGTGPAPLAQSLAFGAQTQPAASSAGTTPQ